MNFQASPGLGVTAIVEGADVVIGNDRQLRAVGVDPSPLGALADAHRSKGAGVMYVAVAGRLAGLLSVADPIKTNARDTMATLHGEGLRIVMLTGDNAVTAKAVAEAVGGLDEVRADLQPQDKASVIAAFQKGGQRVAMAGDGVNDAPALAQADIGIAMGSGSDVAIESAGMTLIGGDLTAVIRARRLARATMRNIRQNLAFAFLYNAAGVPIAAGVLYPVFGILLSPMVGAAAMALSSVSVIANALRLARTRPD